LTRNVLFRHPVHVLDTTDILKDAKSVGEEPPWMEKQRIQQESRRLAREEADKALDDTIGELAKAGPVTVKDVAQSIGKDEKTIRRNIKRHGGYTIEKGIINPTEEEE
jgi:hypothetical protein